jgi:TIM-barrel protein
MFEPRVALASLSGEADAAWARAGADYAGLAVLGGIALDGPTREAARKMVADRDRTEFLPADPIGFIDDQLSALADDPIQAGFNVRTTTLDRLAAAAEVCRDHGALLELNAHCRQEEMCATGAGQSLLATPDRLSEQVETATETGATVSVKVRTEVPGVDLPAVAGAADDAGADVIHVDAMDSEAVVADVAAATDAFVIANNGVRGEESVREYAAYGADAVSVGRPSDDPAVLSRVHAAAESLLGSGGPEARSGNTQRQEGDS